MERGLLALPRVVSGFSGVVLAGGRSSRMGRDKALLVLRGATLLDHAIALLRAAGASEVLISGDRAAHGGVPDLRAGIGPVGGIAGVLPQCGTRRMLVIPVDMPLLDVATLRPLLDALDHAPAACHARHPLPWAARVDADLAATVERLIAADPHGPSMRALHAAVGGVELEPGDGGRLCNINTPEEWAALDP